MRGDRNVVHAASVILLFGCGGILLFGCGGPAPSVDAGTDAGSAPDTSVPDATIDEPPTIRFLTPEAGVALSDRARVAVEATDDGAIVEVVIEAGGVELARLTSPPYEVEWELCDRAEGAASLRAVARDDGGQTSEATLSVTVRNADLAPTLAVRARYDYALELSYEACGRPGGYRIHWADEPGVTEGSASIDVSETEYLHERLDPLRTYYYRVAGVFDGVVSPLSAEVSGVPTARACRADGFCVMEPWLPTSRAGGGDLWGSAPDDVYAARQGLFHYDGRTWTQLPVFLEEKIEAVHGTGPDDVWVTGRDFVASWDGSSWTDRGVRELFGDDWEAVWAAAPDAVFFAGPNGLLRWDGSTFTHEFATDVHGLWGAAPDDVYASGQYLYHWNGASWTEESRFAGSTFYDVWGSGDTLWVVGSHVRRRVAGEWELVPFSGGDVRAVWGDAPDRVHVAGANGVSRFDGTSFAPVSDDDAADVWTDGAGAAWWIGVRREGSIFSPTLISTIGRASASGVERFESPYEHEGIVNTFALRSQAAWFVSSRHEDSSTAILRWDGAAIVEAHRVGSGRFFQAVWASAEDDVWAVGGDDTLAAFAVHYDGTSYDEASLPAGAAQLRDVWGTGPGDVWTVGDGGTVLHRSGTGWSAVPSGTTETLHAVTGTSPDDVWIGGEAGQTYRFDGSSLQPGPSLPGVATPVWVLVASPSGEIWAASGDRLFRTSGASWTEVAFPSTIGDYTFINAGIGDVAFLSADRALITVDAQYATATTSGIRGFVLEWNAGAFTLVPDWPITSGRASVSRDGDVWFAFPGVQRYLPPR